MLGTNRSGHVGGEKSLLCDPGSELRLGGRENRRAKMINGRGRIVALAYSSHFMLSHESSI